MYALVASKAKVNRNVFAVVLETPQRPRQNLGNLCRAGGRGHVFRG
jgi:hypothetical protein